jgi:hypothetical protein
MLAHAHLAGVSVIVNPLPVAFFDGSLAGGQRFMSGRVCKTEPFLGAVRLLTTRHIRGVLKNAPHSIPVHVRTCQRFAQPTDRYSSVAEGNGQELTNCGVPHGQFLTMIQGQLLRSMTISG